jgi:tellurium resistance protein TerZ
MSTALAPGQEVPLVAADGGALTAVTIGLGWDKEPGRGFIGSGAPDVDLDASAIEYAGAQYFDFAFFNNLRTRDGAVVHLGDNTTGRGEGDDESITIDLAAVYGRVDAILLLVTSYQGHPLDWVRAAYCRVVAGDGAEVARFTLTGGVAETGVVMAKLRRTDSGWVLRAIGDGIPVREPTAAVEALRPYV